jgi:phosphonate transport system permease protein
MSEAFCRDTLLEQYEKRPRRWLAFLLVILVVLAFLLWSGSSIAWKGFATKGSEVASGILYGLIRPNVETLTDLSKEGVPYLLLETIAIALLGTLFGGILAIPFSFLCSSRIVPKPVAFIFRGFIMLIRTIPSFVWALCWIRVTGPGAFCGVVTQSVCSIGMIAKMYITAIDDLDTHILESLSALGCTGFQKVRFGILPQLIPNFISTTIYRFDINVKDATTLGIVGAGGIGVPLIQSISSRRWTMVGSYVFVLIVFMLIVELVSTRIRKKLARG